MPRRDNDRDSVHDDSDRPRPKKRDNTLLYVLLAVGGVMVLGCGGLVALFALGWTQAVRDVQQQPAGFRQTMTRDEFKRAVMGKSKQEVINAVGKPDRTQDLGGVEFWYYDNATIDPVTGKVDSKAQVGFTDGKASGVTY